MKSILVEYNYEELPDSAEIASNFDKCIEKYKYASYYSNSVSSAINLVYGSINFFANLDSNFLGLGFVEYSPSSEADNFANMFYRLDNSINRLSTLWKLQHVFSEEWKMIKDIRTLIVHSGERIENINSLKLKNFKDYQLGNIVKTDEGSSGFFKKDCNHDYRMVVWTDKNDKNKNRNVNDFDYDQERENFSSEHVYLKASSIRNIILKEIDSFTKSILDLKSTYSFKKLPMEIKNISVNLETIDFKKIINIINTSSRSSYIKENNRHIWDGYGLEKLWNYVISRNIIEEKTKIKIREIICNRLSLFFDKYNDTSIEDDDLPSLSIIDVFKDFTPEYLLKNYYENQKLFQNIAPNFNCLNLGNYTDVGYLLGFLESVEDALGLKFDICNTVDGIICDYFILSVQKHLES